MAWVANKFRIIKFPLINDIARFFNGAVGVSDGIGDGGPT